MACDLWDVLIKAVGEYVPVILSAIDSQLSFGFTWSCEFGQDFALVILCQLYHLNIYCSGSGQ